MRGNWKKIVAISLASATILAGCIPASFPTGTFHRTGDQAPLRLVFSPVGTLSLMDGTGTEVDLATYQASEDQIAVESETTCPNTAGIYTWAFDGQTLKLTAVSDDCTERKDKLTTFDWVKE